MAYYEKPYYDYTAPVGGVLSDPSVPLVDNPANYPTTFKYSQTSAQQGIVPPAPIYSTTSSAQPYYWPSNTSAPASYYPYTSGWPTYSSYASYTSPSYYNYNNYSSSSWYNAYNANHISNALGLPYKNYSWPTSYTSYSPYFPAPAPQSYWPQASTNPWISNPWASNPWATTPWSAGSSLIQQAAAVLAENAARAAQPSAPLYFPGMNTSEIMAQNAIVAAQMGWQGTPKQLAPYKPSDTQQVWCKELDGSWTLRELTDFVSGDITAGRWETHPTSGYRYFIRTPA